MLELLIILTLTATAPAWEQIRDEDGIRVLRHDAPDDELVAFKAETIIDAPLEQVAAVLVDTPRRVEWMPMLLENRVVRRYSDTERLEYMALKTPPLVANRDFVFRGKALYDGERGELRLDFLPGDDAEVPANPDFVRGRVLGGGYVLRRVKDGAATYAEYSVHCDPMGSIPTWIVNALAHNAPFNTLANLRDRLREAPVTVPPEVSQLLDGVGSGQSWKRSKTSSSSSSALR